MRRLILLTVLAGVVLTAPTAMAADPLATLRNYDIPSSPKAPPMAGLPEKEERQIRNYPEQPPVIPHDIRGYQVDLNANKCLSCHSRKAAPGAGAPMVSVTHYMDREGQVRAFVTSRRYFCTQCHVPQHDVKPLVGNTFEGVDSVVEREEKAGRK